MGNAIVCNVVSETIVNIEKSIKGEEVDMLDSAITVVAGTVIDVGFGKVMDYVDEKMVSLKPKNYSTYAGEQYKKNPDLTMPEIKTKIGRINNAVNAGREVVSFTASVARSFLWY